MVGDAVTAVCLIIITMFIPPLGVFFISGCSPDLLINVCLTLLGYFPGHIHAFYCEYVYYDRRGRGSQGRMACYRAPGIFSERIQRGGDLSNTEHYYPPPPPQTAATPGMPATPATTYYSSPEVHSHQESGWTR
ncbi:hypothetical protein PABG_11882 [Paracoccidioides brasiliensis Pb03]|uniref:Plasma membrane proteolipid 3 n=1 Tax=Paracoccidioides brasiliensis (strain Pb18) TaxID=502780 RepID=C1GJW5_PARBD|nr:uncharacterized protein PADG_07551 [Paracoccidioides brasiliensis Pb18]EEH42731.2 hypothetical protein PADG_07551 [Paracoccidioides brasiliensis Pb18]KGY15295.1 hypothetical protein PABG_11882 [Paracoccidioides brasiliensis Pb03]ODH52783.1 hypothetical protein GX48_00977 [Paracoccidioides brasiliensis]